jgi:hypothetical protein
MHYVSKSCAGERCGPCLRNNGERVPATHKVGEEIPFDDPLPMRHNLTQYVCCMHFTRIMGPAAPCKETH